MGAFPSGGFSISNDFDTFGGWAKELRTVETSKSFAEATNKLLTLGIRFNQMCLPEILDDEAILSDEDADEEEEDHPIETGGPGDELEELFDEPVESHFSSIKVTRRPPSEAFFTNDPKVRLTSLFFVYPSASNGLPSVIPASEPGLIANPRRRPGFVANGASRRRPDARL